MAETNEPDKAVDIVELIDLISNLDSSVRCFRAVFNAAYQELIICGRTEDKPLVDVQWAYLTRIEAELESVKASLQGGITKHGK